MRTRETACSVVTGIVVTLASTGPLISFYALSVWWSVATTLLAAAGIAFLYLAGWTDPGYLEQFSDRDPLIDILVEQSRPALQNTRSVRIRVEYEGETYVRYLQDGSWVKLEPGLRRGHRYCGACNIWRPPHAHHCQHSQRCVEHFDHYCEVLQICVGGSNHRWFTLFLLSCFFASLALAWGGVLTIIQLGFYNVTTPPWQFWGTLIVEPIYMYAILVTCVGWLHLGLMCAVVSTKDIIHYGCGTCNERACQPNGFQFLASQWRRQWFSPVRCLPGTPCHPSEAPEAVHPSETEPLLPSDSTPFPSS